jgi:hypothetical protein
MNKNTLNITNLKENTYEMWFNRERTIFVNINKIKRKINRYNVINFFCTCIPISEIFNKKLLKCNEMNVYCKNDNDIQITSKFRKRIVISVDNELILNKLIKKLRYNTNYIHFIINTIVNLKTFDNICNSYCEITNFEYFGSTKLYKIPVDYDILLCKYKLNTYEMSGLLVNMEKILIIFAKSILRYMFIDCVFHFIY